MYPCDSRTWDILQLRPTAHVRRLFALKNNNMSLVHPNYTFDDMVDKSHMPHDVLFDIL